MGFFFACALAIGCLAHGDTLFCDTFEKGLKPEEWIYATDSAALDSLHNWIGVKSLAAFEGNKGLTLGPCVNLMGKEVCWQAESPLLTEGVYCSFVLRINSFPAAAGSRDRGPYVSFLHFNSVIPSGNTYYSPVLLVRKDDMGKNRMLLLLRRKKNDNPVQLVVPSGDGFSFDVWHTIKFYLRLRSDTLFVSCAIDSNEAVEGATRLLEPIGQIQQWLLGCYIPSGNPGISGIDLDDFILSTRPVATPVAGPSIAREDSSHLMNLEFSSDSTNYFQYNDTLTVSFEYWPEPGQGQTFIDVNLRAASFKGDTSGRFGVLDTTSNLVFSLNPLSDAYYRDFKSWQTISGTETTLPARAFVKDRYWHSNVTGMATMSIVLGKKFKKGEWTISARHVRGNGTLLATFKPITFYLGVASEKNRKIIRNAVVASLALCLIFAIILRRAQKARLAAMDYPESWKRIAEDTEKLLQENFGDSNLDGNSVADKIQLSRQRLLIIYQRVKGKSPSQHLREIRIEKASEMLEKTAESVTEIGYKVGFSDPHHFIRNFKKIKGLTPSQYRDNKK